MVQEVFLKLIESPEKFDTQKKFSTWVYTITANKSKNRIRSKETRLELLKVQRYLSNGAKTMLHHEADMNQLKLQLQHIFDQLNDKEKNIFKLRFEEQKSIKEIAIELNLPEGSIKSGIHYLLKKYSSLLKHFNYEQ